MNEEFMPILNKSTVDVQTKEIKKSYFSLDNVSYIVLLVTLILSPLAFVSTSYISIDVVKTAVITFGVLISSIFCIITYIKEKRTFSFFNNSLSILSVFLVISIIISGFLSTNIAKSFVGQGFEIGTASFLLLMFVTIFLVSHLVSRNKDRILYAYAGVLASFLILALFHIMRFAFGADFLSFGILNTLTSTLIGKWYDLGILTGVVAILSFISIQFLSLNKGLKILLTILLIISGFFLAVINFNLVWISLAVIILAVNIYQFLKKPSQGSGIKKIISRLSIVSLIVFIVSLIFVWKGDVISAPLIKSLNIEQSEILLPWQLTLDVSSNTLKESPLFGAGPNRFINQYLRFKPLQVNQTPFWNYEFNNGFGFIPTSLVTQGLVGFTLWILFLIFFVYVGIKALKKATEQSSRFIISSTFFTSSFLWLISLIYFPSHFTIFLTFVFTGLFVASLASEHLINNQVIANSQESRLQIFLQKYSYILSIVFLIVFLVWVLIYVKKDMALGYFQSGVKAFRLQDEQGIAKAKNNFTKALAWDRSDIYYQALSEVNISKTNTIAQQIQSQIQKGEKTPNPELVKQINDLITEAVQYTRNAITIDPTNYYNHLAEARISEIATTFQMQNAYENTKTAYNNAINLNPFNPALYLSLARLEAMQNKTTDADRNIGIAIQLKPNYTEAIFFLSQLQVNRGQIKEAIISSQVAIQTNPTNPLLYFQLGILQYNDKNYQSAVDALSKAVELNNQYANARYFLGLSLSRLNKNQEALVQFEEIAKTNPGNQELMLIISNLKANRSPFADAKPPIDSKPEKRKTLPVKEKAINTKADTTN